jgi:hypothetical protein
MRLVSLVNWGRKSVASYLVFTATLLVLLALARPAAPQPSDVTESEAQPGTPDWANKRARDAFFQVSVSGQTARPDIPNQRQGKAFAVGPHLLVTSQHVIGDASDWKPRDSANDGRPLAIEIKRALRPVDRTIEITRALPDSPIETLTDSIVLPTPYALDTAALLLPNNEFKKYFRLSLCDIKKGDKYGAIMVTEDPTEPSSAKSGAFVELEAEGYKPEQFGPLYLFVRTGGANFNGSSEGHDGSPILDGEGNVVAVVSAVSAKGGSGYLVLATPIQPLFPAASALMARSIDFASDARATSLKCSLSDTVKQIREEVSAHVSWKEEPERDGENILEELRLHYDPMSPQTAIQSMVVEYNYWGTRGPEAPNGMKPLPVPVPTNINTYSPSTEQGRERDFDLTDIVRIGRQVLEPELKRKGGYIEKLSIDLYRISLGGDRYAKPQTIEIKWQDPKPRKP